MACAVPDAQLTAAEKQRILCGNAIDLFKLDVRPSLRDGTTPP